MENIIPVKNIYYMLCYAWDRLDFKDIAEIDSLDSNEIMDLFALVLTNGVSYLIRRGFYRQYMSVSEEESVIRGKININESLRKKLWLQGKLFCEYDELSHNIIHNRIIKTTIGNLISCEDLNPSLRKSLAKVYKYFDSVERVKLNNTIFGKAFIHRNNRYYSFLIDICEIIYKNLLVNEETGVIKFKEFIRDEKQMALLFENFVRNFYKKELKNAKVYRENIKWDTDKDKDVEYLPLMQTDISLEKINEKLIIETKYKRSAFTYNYDAKKLHSENLYQIFSYIKNVKRKAANEDKVVGILLYPKTGDELDLEYSIQGHILRIKTVNLHLHWEEIHERLLDIVNK